MTHRGCEYILGFLSFYHDSAMLNIIHGHIDLLNFE